MGLREEKEQLTRHNIMDMAFDLFCAQGIEPTEMLQIARKAKISRPTLYRYFETKERLAEEVYLRNLEQTLIATIEFSNDMTTLEIVTEFLQVVIQELQEHPKRLVYDAIYNLYASRLHIDPTRIPSHPLNTKKYLAILQSKQFTHPDETIRFSGAGEELMHAVLYPFFTYIQRLAIFSFQKDPGQWEETLQEACILRDFYLTALKPETPNSGK
ncbi:MAG: TetR/AcrR family transcriptional regulator [Anaerolineae bacterium]|jgi:AcrR family transcriptional regulator|nr:TetR/AcrR family transcriptional regulator [Anaerolineae bacterium]